MDRAKIFKETISKLERFCDYQERCTADVQKKMYDLKSPEFIIDDVIEYLIENKFLDDLRYAKSFVYGKFSNKKWGRKKIYAALRAKRVKSEFINIAFNDLDEDEYYKTLVYICDIKSRSIGDLKQDLNKKKLMNFALQRGFESSLIWKYINAVNNKS